MMKFYLTALGCKLNQAEMEDLARQIEARGHSLVSDPQNADWGVVNTCTVTHVAARKSRQLIRHLHRENPCMRMVATGCFAETDREHVAALEGVALVVGNLDKDRIMDLLVDEFGLLGEDGCSPESLFVGDHPAGRTRAAIKIQDGCDNECSYCIVTVARGAQRSCPYTEILQEAQMRLAEGYRELVLTGVHIGAYGRDSAPGAALPPDKGWTLARLVALLLEHTDVQRLRLSSIEPWDFTDELLSLWKDQRLCRHIHLPLQSGSDTVLKRMRRKYTTSDFHRLVDHLREQIPGVALTTDLIVGFPGETQEEFQESYAFCQSMAFSRLHVFKYSARPGTRAAAMSNPVSPQIAQERSRELIELGRTLALDFHNQMVGRQVRVLFEVARSDGPTQVWDGLTDNYVRVRVTFEAELHNRLALVRCTGADASAVWGEVVHVDTEGDA